MYDSIFLKIQDFPQAFLKNLHKFHKSILKSHQIKTQWFYSVVVNRKFANITNNQEIEWEEILQEFSRSQAKISEGNKTQGLPGVPRTERTQLFMDTVVRLYRQPTIVCMQQQICRYFEIMLRIGYL